MLFFLCQKDFHVCLRHFLAFFLFLLQKDSDIFQVILFEAFLCLFDNVYLPFLYVENIFKKFLWIYKILKSD